MRGHVIAVLFLLCGVAGRAYAQTPRPPAAPGANPRDISEVFLALPVPAGSARGPVLASFGDRLATRALREQVLERARGPEGFSTLDPRNGYLDMCVQAPDYRACRGRLTLTYFNQRNGDRLVVMQAMDEHTLRTEDYFWRLSGGRFTPVDGRTLLPDLVWADFWGDQRLPGGLSPRFFRELGAMRLSWPQEGTDVHAVLDPLYSPEPDPRIDQFNELFNRRRFSSVQLLWDRQRGVFTRGRGVPYDPEEEEHHHDH